MEAMIVPARKAVAFLEKHDTRVRDPISPIAPDKVSSLLREARVLLYGATPDEQVLLWQFIAVCEARLENLPKALEVLESARAMRPQSPYAANDLGVTLARMNRKAEALGWFLAAAELSHDDPVSLAVSLLNEVLCRVDMGDTPAAAAALRRAERLNVPDLPALLVLKASAVARFGREDDVVEYLARSFCARASQPRGEDPALDILDRLAPDLENTSVLPKPLSDAVRAVRERERSDTPTEMAPRARVQLAPEAWAALQHLVAE